MKGCVKFDLRSIFVTPVHRGKAAKINFAFDADVPIQSQFASQ
jgi:hypothetical protein